MIALDSPRWGMLESAWGNSDRVPGLIRAVARTGSDNDWRDLTEFVFHAGQRRVVTVAAIPHMVALATEQDRIRSAWFVGLMGSVAMPFVTEEIPPDLAEDFDGALSEVRAAAWTALRSSIQSDDDFISTVDGLGKLMNNLPPGDEFWRALSDEKIDGECFDCQQRIAVDFREAIVGRADRVGRLQEATAMKIELADAGSNEKLDTLLSMFSAAGKFTMVPVLRGIFGRSPCPNCEEPVEIFDDLVARREFGPVLMRPRPQRY